MGILPCPLPCQQSKEESDSEQSHSNSSLSSQPSLPSVPSLTHQLPSAANAAVHHHCTATLKGHTSYVFSLALSGKLLYSGSSTGEIRVWNRDASQIDISSNNLVAEGNSAVKWIVVTGDKLFSAHQDHKIRVWKIDSETSDQKYKCVGTLPTMNDRLAKLFLAKNYVEVRRHKKCTWVHHVDTVSALAVSRDGSLIYSVSWDRSLKVWRTSDFKCLESVQNAHDDAINAVVSSGDGFVYTGSADRKIKVWKMSKQEGEKSHALVATLEKHRSAVNALAISADGSALYSGACDRSIIVWEKDSGNGGDRADHMTVAGALRGHTKAILSLAVVSDLLCSGSADKTVRIWRRGIGKSYCCLAVLEGHGGPVKSLTGAVDGGENGDSGDGSSYLIYSGGLDRDIKVWKIWLPSF